MSVLSFINDAANKVVSYFTDETPAVEKNKSSNKKIKKTNVQNMSYPNSAVNPKGETVGTVGDVVVKTSQENKTKTTTSTQNPVEKQPKIEKSSRQINQAIAVTCQKHSLDLEKLITGIERITGLVKDEDKKEQLSETQKTIMLSVILNSLNKAIEAKETKYKDIDVIDAVLMDATITSEIIIKKKTFKDLMSFDSEIKDNASDFINGINNIKTVEEFEALKAEFEAKMNAKYNAKKAEISKLPAEQRDAAIKKLKAKQEAIRERILSHYVFGNTSNEISMNALTMASSNSVGKMTNALYSIQPNDKARAKLAKMHSFGLDEKILKAQQARGEKFNPESYQEYVQTNVSWKDSESLNAYQDEVMNAANNKKDPKYSFLTDEIIMATNKGVGIGAQMNHIMTSSEKAEFAERWTNDVKNYYGENSKEYKSLKSYVEQKVEEYSSAKSSTKEKTDLKAETTQQPRQNIVGQNASLEFEQNAVPVRSLKFVSRVMPNNTINKAAEEKKQTEANVRRKVLAGAITKDTEVMDALGLTNKSQLVEYYAKDPDLRDLKKEYIRIYIKDEKDENKLLYLAKKVPEIIPFIIENMRGDKKSFTDKLKQDGHLSHDQQALLKKELQNVA